MPLEPSRVLGRRHGPVPLAWTASDAAAYERAVHTGGHQADSPPPRARAGSGVVVLPTFAATLARKARPDFRDLGLDPRHVLHLSQALELLAPLPSAATAVGRFEVSAVFDAGSRGAVLETRTSLEAPSGEPLAVATSRYLARGAGGYGGTAPPASRADSPPARPPDAVIDCLTRRDQAIQYAELGDTNPLHLDAGTARAAGFRAPILHGLCTYGIVGLAVVAALCEGDRGRLSTLALDFRAPVYPGELLQLEAWLERGRVHLRLVVPARAGLVTAQGRCSLASEAGSSDPR